MKQLNWYQIFGNRRQIPDGRTVLPTDDIQIWLNCADIWDKTYTTLAEVLADTDTLLALITSNNAVDYLVRSKTFAKSEALVPKMTSNTTPSGECFGSSVNSSTYDYYKAFDGDNSTMWAPSTGNMPQTIGYKSASAICVKSLKIYPYIYNGTTPSIATFQLQGSNDNSTWVDIGNVKTIDSVGEKEFTYDSNNTSYLYHQIKVLSKNVSGGCNVYSLQFYSIAEGLTDNATAMSYIGLNNYASDALLADSTWRTAIANSTYIASVCNVKNPNMTSNTAPSGVCSGTTNATGSGFWKLFNGQTSTSNTQQWNYPTTNDYVQYSFGYGVKGVCARYYAEISYNMTVKSKIANQFVDVASGNSNYNAWKNYIYNQYQESENGDFRISFPNVSNDRLRIYQIEFYGRKDV